MDILLAKEENGLVATFSSILNTPMDNYGRISVPEQFGRGYLQAFNFNPGLRMMIRDYQLKEKLPIRKNTPNCFTESVILLFQNISLPDTKNNKFLPSVQVFPEHVDAEILFPGINVFKSIAIAVKVAYLKELLKGDLGNEILTAITRPDQTFLFEALLPPSMDKLTKEILQTNIPVALRNFYFKVKGTGIFQYYQAFRMQEAARLLMEKQLSVSEVGYQMGFSTLSHFTRTFEKHLGMKPKKYARS